MIVRSQDEATGYRPGLYACIAACLLCIVCVAACTLAYYIDNGKADRGEKELETSDASPIIPQFLSRVPDPQC